MAKLLKHFGLDFRSKTLPASTTDRDSVHATDTSKTFGRRNTGGRSHTDECSDCASRNATLSSHSNRRASHDTFLTIPARRVSARTERDWTLRGTKSREPAAFCGSRQSELTGSKKRCNSDAKDLRRSVTTEEILPRTDSTVAPAVCITQYCMLYGSCCSLSHGSFQEMCGR